MKETHFTVGNSLTGPNFWRRKAKALICSYHLAELCHPKDFYMCSEQYTCFIPVNFIIFSSPYMCFQQPTVLERVMTLVRVSKETEISRPDIISLAKRCQRCDRLECNFGSRSHRNSYLQVLLCHGFASLRTKLIMDMHHHSHYLLVSLSDLIFSLYWLYGDRKIIGRKKK